MKRIITTTIAAVAIALPGVAALAQQKMDDMKGMDMGKKPAANAQAVHKTRATVKKVDAKAGSVTLAHEPVASLNWPAMTMGFKVKDTALLSKLTEGKRVEVEFAQEGRDYVIQSVQ